MKFNFKLENVLKQRQLTEDIAQKNYREADAYLREEERRLREMRAKVVEARDYAHTTVTNIALPQVTLAQVHEFIKGQDVRIERQLKKVQEIERRVEDLREILRLRAIDTKIMEGLKEKKREQFAEKKAKLEQKNNDDLMVMRHGRA